MYKTVNMKRSGLVTGIIIVLAFIAFWLVGHSSQAQTRSIAGSWSGSGYLKPASGQRERVRCRAKFSKITSKLFSFSATCASAAGSVRQTGQLTRATSTRYIGVFNNAQYGISGRIRIVVKGSRQTVYLSGNQGSGQLSSSRR